MSKVRRLNIPCGYLAKGETTPCMSDRTKTSVFCPQHQPQSNECTPESHVPHPAPYVALLALRQRIERAREILRGFIKEARPWHEGSDYAEILEVLEWEKYEREDIARLAQRLEYERDGE